MPSSKVNSIRPSSSTSPSGTQHGGVLVQPAPQLDAEVDEGDLQDGEQGQHATAPGPLVRRAAEAAHGEVADVRDEEERRGRQPGVPTPEHTPGQPPPQHPDEQRDRHEQHADLGARPGQAVPAEGVLAREQIQRRRQRRDGEGQVGDPGRRGVEVEHPHGFALALVGRREDEGEQDEHGHPGDRWRCRGSGSPASPSSPLVRRSLVGPRSSRCSRLVLDERAERQRAPGAEDDGEHGDEPCPGPAVRDRLLGAERCFDRSGCSDQNRRHHWEQEQREQCLPPSCTSGEAAVERTNGRQRHRGRHPRDQQEEHAGRAGSRRCTARPPAPAARPARTASSTARAAALPQNSADGSDAGDVQGVEGTVLALDGERALYEQQQRERRRQHDQTRSDSPHQRRCRRWRSRTSPSRRRRTGAPG